MKDNSPIAQCFEKEDKKQQLLKGSEQRNQIVTNSSDLEQQPNDNSSSASQRLSYEQVSLQKIDNPICTNDKQFHDPPCAVSLNSIPFYCEQNIEKYHSQENNRKSVQIQQFCALKERLKNKIKEIARPSLYRAYFIGLIISVIIGKSLWFSQEFQPDHQRIDYFHKTKNPSRLILVCLLILSLISVTSLMFFHFRILSILMKNQGACRKAILCLKLSFLCEIISSSSIIYFSIITQPIVLTVVGFIILAQYLFIQIIYIVQYSSLAAQMELDNKASNIQQTQEQCCQLSNEIPL